MARHRRHRLQLQFSTNRFWNRNSHKCEALGLPPFPGLPSAPPTASRWGAVDRAHLSPACCPGTGQGTQTGGGYLSHLCHPHSPSSPRAPRCCVEPLAHASSPTCNTNSSGVSPDSPLLPCPRQHVSGCVHVLWTRLCRKTGDFLQEKQCPVQPGFCTISYCSEPFLSHQREEGPTSSPHSPQTRDSESVNSPSEECRK